jgi:hypothetical protein
MQTLLLTTFLLTPLSLQDPPGSATPLAEAAPAWAFGLSALYVDPPDDDGYTTTIVYADRGPLHLEARYNYEDRDTASLFVGWTFEVGEELHAALTPMLGGVFGDTRGVAPGLLVDADWRKLNFYTEAEYLFDTDDSDDNFFYSWSTLMWQFNDAFAAGIVTERTQLVDTGRDLQRGIALRVTPGPVGFSLYAYNPGSDDDYYTLSVEFSL